jgi:hypothetical protein
MLILAVAAVIALGVGVAGSAFAEGEGGSATGAVQWHQADSSTAPATQPTAKIQLAYARRHSTPRKTTARANFFSLAQAVAGPAGERRRGFLCRRTPDRGCASAADETFETTIQKTVRR